jgi:hypothetical protein
VADVAPSETVLRLTVTGGDLVDGPVRAPVGAAEWRAARLDPVADCSAGRAVDARLDFPSPLEGVAGLHVALRTLTVAPGAEGCGGRDCGLRDCGRAGPRP